MSAPGAAPGANDALLRFLRCVCWRRADASSRAWDALLELLLQRQSAARAARGRAAAALASAAAEVGDGADAAQRDAQRRLAAADAALRAAEDEAVEAVESPDARYDERNALVLVQSAGFRRGEIVLYERLRASL